MRAWSAGADEVVVCDGGSQDETAELASLSKCTLLSCDQGRGTQLNAGAERATGDVFLFLHADCWLVADGCGQIRRRFADRPQTACGAFQQRIENDRLVYRFIEWGNRLRVSCLSMAYGDQGIFVSRQRFVAAGGFDDVPLMEDFCFSKRLKKICRYEVFPGPLYVSPRRWEENGPLRQTLFNWKTVASFLSGKSPADLAKQYYKSSNS